jgi:acetyltransferase-like isoleucine patch superfamily enzyme
MARLVIFGTGDIARLANFYFTRDSPHEVVAFTVDAEYRRGDSFEGLPLVDSSEVVSRFPPGEHEMFVAISYARMNQIRAAKYAQMKSAGYRLVSYVSSRCSYLSDHPPGDNCFILEDNTIQPFVRIGNDVTLCFLTSHVVVSGNVRVRPYCFIGVNATIRNSIEIAPATLVGAGAVIMKNTREKGVYLPQRAERFSKSSDEIEL